MQLVSPHGHPLTERTSATDNTARLAAWDQATVAALKALDSTLLSPGRCERVRSLDMRDFYWSPTSELDADDQLVIIPDDLNADVNTDLDEDGAGRWLAVPGQIVDIEMAFTYATADGATLYTVPDGCYLLVRRGYWEITTGMTGGSSSAIGLSSDQTGHTTKGDLHGGSGGDVAATLIAGDYIAGTVGADVAAGIILQPGKLVKFDRVASAFTAGAGKAHLVYELLTNPGA